MKKQLRILLFFIIFITYPSIIIANDTFVNGELNIQHVGKKVGITGEVIEIKSDKGFPLYKINLKIDYANHIWIAYIGQIPNDGINIGDNVIFRGFLNSSNKMDPSGKLKEKIGKDTLLLAHLCDKI